MADHIVSKNAYAINPRGELYTSRNIKQRLATRDFMQELRDNGVETSGPKPYTDKDRQTFANTFDRVITKLINGKRIL